MYGISKKLAIQNTLYTLLYRDYVINVSLDVPLHNCLDNI